MRRDVQLAAAVAMLIASASAALRAGAQVAQPGASIAALTRAYNLTGHDLLAAFSGSPGNLVLSPYSVGAAMSMALTGARGDTEREMLSALNLGGEYQRLGLPNTGAANAELLATLNGYDHSATPPSCPSDMQLVGARCRAALRPGGYCTPPMQREGDDCMGGAKLPPSASLLVADALMLPKVGAVSPGYAQLLKDSYAAELFENAKPADVNAWVARKTGGKIDGVVEQRNEAVPGVTILNAVYFKSRWASPFDEKRTNNEVFHLSSAQEVEVSMMKRTGYYAMVARQGYRAIRLPYVITSLAMIIVLPDDIDGLPDVVQRFDAGEQAALLTAMRAAAVETEFELALPRFKVESDLDLVPPFKKVGMRLAFDGTRADFSGVTGKPLEQERLFIATIKHRATIDVAEESTEAAAVTIVKGSAGATPAPPRPPPQVFRVDRPFLFYLVDDATGAVLFAGRVLSPPQLSQPATTSPTAAVPRGR
jgi:serpin B